MNSKQKKTLSDVFVVPPLAGIVWDDIEKLFKALGGEVKQGNGSRIKVKLNGVKGLFHRPHPEKETDKGAVADVSEFLTEAGIKLSK